MKDPILFPPIFLLPTSIKYGILQHFKGDIYMNDFIIGMIFGIVGIKIIEYRLKKSEKYQKIANFLIGNKKQKEENDK